MGNTDGFTNKLTLECKKVTTQPSILVLLNWYSESRGNLRFKYDISNSQLINIED